VKPTKPTLYIKPEPKTVEWYTPTHLVEKVVAVLGQIDLDPCSNRQKSIPAKLHYRKGDNGLKKQWHGSVFMNPPWGAALQVWATKFLTEWNAGHITEAITLTPAQPINRKWFSRFFIGQAAVFITGSVHFWNSKTDDNNPGWPFPIVVQYLGKDEKKFIEEFKDLGIIVQRVK
jgi:hypothetical protein